MLAQWSAKGSNGSEDVGEPIPGQPAANQLTHDHQAATHPLPLCHLYGQQCAAGPRNISQALYWILPINNYYVMGFTAQLINNENVVFLFSAQLPARATRLLNRSRLQDQQLTGNDSDNSLRSSHSGGASAAARKRSTANSRTSSGSTASLPRQRHLQQHHLGSGGGAGAGGGGGGGGATASGTSTQRCGGELHSSSDDLMLYDKSFRNAMIQDVLQFKKQLLRLRRILQEVSWGYELTLRTIKLLNKWGETKKNFTQHDNILILK